MTAINKKPKFLPKLLAFFAAAFFLLFAAGCDKGEYRLFSPQPAELPEADRYALEQYDSESLSDVRATLRADTMYVTERGLKRPQVKMLSDNYTLSRSTKSGKKYTSSINFTAYPSPSRAVKAEDFTEAALLEGAEHGIDTGSEAGRQEALKKYFSYYKYMLLSQSTELLAEVKRNSESGRLSQDSLYKHPAADAQYGAVTGTDNAVSKVIVMDPVYRSYHVTGLYLPAGEAVTVQVEGLKSGEKISVFVALNDSMGWKGSVASQPVQEALARLDAGSEAAAGDYFTCADIVAAGGKFYDTFSKNEDGSFSTTLLSNQWNRQNSRMPRLSVEFVFDGDGVYTIGSPFGGVMHLGPKNCYSPVKTTFTGAVETPHYILGVTTPEYFDTYLRDEATAPGVYSALDTENGQLVGPSSYMRKIETGELEKLAMLWHSFFSVNESFSGGTYNRNNVVKFDVHVPAGAAVALGGMVYACPAGWYGSAMNYRSLLTSGSWGILHEIGHSHASAYGTAWGFNGSQEGEVRNNALIALSYIKFCDIGTQRNDEGNVPAEHGFVAHPYSNLKKTLSIAASSPADFNDLEYFSALSVYVNIMHSFGADKFYELLLSYKDTPSYIPSDDGGQPYGNRRSEFVYRLAKVYGMDFRPYANDIYKAGVTDAMFSAEQLSFMAALPVYRPVANLYAGGIDGVKTGGDYRINYGSEVVFDLYGKTLTTAEGFEILSVSQPEYGALTPLGGDKYSYSFKEGYLGAKDSFTFDVKLSDGVIHRFTVYLRLSYNGASVSDYGQVGSGDLNAAEAEISAREPLKVSTDSLAGVANYRNQAANEARVSRFYYRAGRSGSHTFSARADDKLKVYLSDSFTDTSEPKLVINSYTSGFSDAKSFTAELEKGRMYAFTLVNVNTGGAGGAAVGLKNAGGGYAVLPLADVFPAALKEAEKVQPYIYEPRFIVSKKDNAFSSVMTSSKSDWSVVSAPTDISGGRYVTEELKDLETGEVIGRIETDKWTYLIDDKVGTVFHTQWGGGATPATEENPDVFIIDTNKSQPFNFFTINAPARSDYCMKKYDLQISDDNENYRSVASGDTLAYKSGKAELSFPQTYGRYLKLIVKQTSGDNGGAYTVISELSAGVKAASQLLFPSDSGKYYISRGWSKSAVDTGRRGGLLWSDKKNAKLVIRLRGESVALYSDVGPGYGGARIKLDGKQVAAVELNAGESKSRQLIFYAEGLKNKEHTVEIITNSSAPFNLDFVGASYNSYLVNAPNIYLERGLAIALTVFIVLFLLCAAALCVILFVPKVKKALLAERPQRVKKVKPARPKKVKTKRPAAKRTAKGGKKTAVKAKPPAAVGYEGSYEDYVEEVPIGDILKTSSFYEEQQRLKSMAVQPGVFTAAVDAPRPPSPAEETAAALESGRAAGKSKSAAAKSAPAPSVSSAKDSAAKSTAVRSAAAGNKEQAKPTPSKESASAQGSKAAAAKTKGSVSAERGGQVSKTPTSAGAGKSAVKGEKTGVKRK